MHRAGSIYECSSSFHTLAPIPEVISAEGVSALISNDLLCSPVSLANTEGRDSPCVLPSLMSPRKIDFSVCLAFYLLGWSDYHQDP